MAKTPKENDKQAKARSLYMTGQFTQTQLADIVGVVPRTIMRWAEAESWDVILESTKSSKEKRIAKYKGYLKSIEEKIESRESTNDAYPTTAEIDQMTKLESIIKKLQDNASIGEIVMYSKNVCTFVQGYDVEKAKELVGVFDAYIKSLI
ncbi:hypothetical protein [Dysgonomonas sp. GY617]|uniref:hypothetical protein n=1 Tax=Dysgonomonas sp. GY617 TaxID=2780420 RepID=UPI001883F03B|nr:hypothetical protein [Dysgonomonas sp. GY617]MBF0576608.1 hypothetical protein [Dysgonomonas sp. GY617]